MNEPIDQPVADLMTIGRFSQLSRLSLKALRLYDALGLLPPALVDPAHREAFTRITKRQVAFPSILKAYDAVHSWTEAHATRSAPPREVYFADWNTVSDDEPACDIAWPVE